jgi:radical SAM superfamily enzyme YgiQ (UPF0313 family)
LVFKPYCWKDLGLAYLAASLLENGHECDILDLRTCLPSKKEKIVKKEAKKYDWLGFSFMTYAYPEAMKMARLCKEANPEAKIIFGGPHASFTYNELLCYPFLDYIIIGEGERAIVDLISGKKLSEIAGLVYKKKDKIVANPQKVIEDLDSLPFPARDKFKPIDYRYLPVSFLISSRGCPSRCSFCVASRLFPKVRFRNPVKVVDELELLWSRGEKGVWFQDLDFSISREHIQKICTEIKKRKMTFDTLGAQISVDRTDGEKIRWMKKAGFTTLSFGIESLSPSSLKTIGKTINPAIYPKKAIRLLKYARKLGFCILSNYILGLPYQKRDAVMKELKILKENVDELYLYFYTPFPGTPDWERFKDKLITTDLSKFDTQHVVLRSELSNEDLRDIFNLVYPFKERIKNFINLLTK